MNKVCGYIKDFAPISEDRSRIIISYGLEPVGSNNLYTWYEIYFYKKFINGIDFQIVEDAIIADIDAQTDAKILNGYQWTILHGDDTGKMVNVWLSAENQTNYKAKHDTAVQYPNLVEFPMKFKVSEIEDEEAHIKTPVYEIFQNINELAQFYLGGLAYIERTVNEGWARKDSIDWTPYKEYFPEESISNDDNT